MQKNEGFPPPAGGSISFGALFVFILVCLSALRFRLLSSVPLSADEAYHWEWSRHLAFAYYDHPGLVAWVIKLFTLIFGHTLAGIRAGALLSTTIALVVIYWLGKDIGGGARVGFMSFAAAAFTGIMTASSLMMTTDPPYAAAWALCVLFIYLAVFRSKPRLFYAAGAAFGFAMLGKFLGLMLAPCAFLFLLFSREHRFWLKRREPYLAAALGLLVFSPVIYWNAKNDWATFAFNLSIRHEHLKPHLLYFLEYIAGQALLVSPLIFFPLVYILFKSAGINVGREKSRDFFLFSFCAPPLAAFAFVSIFERAGAHWPAAAYITGIPLFVAWFSRRRSRAADRYVWACIILMFAFISAGHVFLLRPDLIPEFKYGPYSKKIDTKYLREFYGWNELGRDLSEKLNRAGQESTFLITPYYSLSATISFYTPGWPFCMHYGPESVHGNNYRYWTDWAALEGKDAIHIGLKELEGSELERLEKGFLAIEPLKPLQIYSHGKLARTFYLTYGYHFNGLPPD